MGVPCCEHLGRWIWDDSHILHHYILVRHKPVDPVVSAFPPVLRGAVIQQQGGALLEGEFPGRSSNVVKLGYRLYRLTFCKEHQREAQGSEEGRTHRRVYMRLERQRGQPNRAEATPQGRRKGRRLERSRKTLSGRQLLRPTTKTLDLNLHGLTRERNDSVMKNISKLQCNSLLGLQYPPQLRQYSFDIDGIPLQHALTIFNMEKSFQKTRMLMFY